LADLRKFSINEKKDFVFNLLEQYELGTTARRMTIDHKIHHVTLIKILNELIRDGKIKGIKFGKAILYKVVK